MLSLREFVELGYDEEEYNEYVEYEKSTRCVYVDDDEPDEFDKAMYYEDDEEDEDESETE